MARGSTGVPAARRTALLMWILPPLFELPAVLMLCTGLAEVGREAVFGRSGTRLTLVAVLLVTAVGAVAAWRAHSTPRPARLATGLTLCVAAGLTAVLAVGFLTRGAYVIVGVLLAHSAVAVAMIARSVLQPAAPSMATGTGR